MVRNLEIYFCLLINQSVIVRNLIIDRVIDRVNGSKIRLRFYILLLATVTWRNDMQDDGRRIISWFSHMPASDVIAPMIATTILTTDVYISVTGISRNCDS
jgi:hypothetical protein